MIGQQLERHHFENRQQQLWSLRHIQYVIGRLVNFVVAFCGDGDHFARTRRYFLDVRHRFFVAQYRIGIVRIARGQHHHRQVLVDQRIGSMLHFPGRIAFRVNVAYLLQLQRAFESNRVVNAAPEEEEILDLLVLLCQSLASFIMIQDRLKLARQLCEFLHQLDRLRFVQLIAFLREE